MIRLAKSSDMKELYFHWKEVFEFDDHGSIDGYFQHVFKPENCYVYLRDNQIIGSLMVHPKEMVLHGKIINVAYIVGVYTLPDYRHQGVMKDLMNHVVKELEYRYVLTVTQAYNPNLYKQFGFEEVYQQQKYLVKRSMIKPMDSDGIRLSVEPHEVVELYQYFTQYFTGYFVRKEADVIRNSKLVLAENGQSVGLYRQNELVAHLRYVVNDTTIVVDEVLYKDTSALIKILNYVLSKYPKILVSVSMVENLEKLMGAELLEISTSLLVKLNDSTLFEHLYNVKVTKASSAIKAFSKPLFNTDFY